MAIQTPNLQAVNINPPPVSPTTPPPRRRNRLYHSEIEQLCGFIIPPGQSVLQIGCHAGDLLAATKPSYGFGIDIDPDAVAAAQAKYPELHFEVGDALELRVNNRFQAVILSDIIGSLPDLWTAFRRLRQVTSDDSRVVITYYNALWEPVLWLAEKLGLKSKQHLHNWMSLDDIENLLNLNGYEVVRKGYRLLFPIDIPLVSRFFNRYVSQLPLIRRLCLIQFIVAREQPGASAKTVRDLTCSVIIPCRNEAGNIADAVARTPMMGVGTEIIFVDGNSNDGTVEKIEEEIARYRGPLKMRWIPQGAGRGKGDAVRKGFDLATGDILFILDADLTVPPEDLPKFYQAIAEGEGEFVNGTRLVYPMEDQSMRFLNLLGNKFFSLVFTWLLDQRIKDTLCGTKVISRENYKRLTAGRSFFGNFDPFGDFDLLFGAAKLNLKIVELPVRYRARVYGDTKIDRFSHGWLLLRMCMVALRKLKFR